MCKVGDRIRINSLEWYESHKDEAGDIMSCGFIEPMSQFCGQEATITKIIDEDFHAYLIDIDGEYESFKYWWMPEHFNIINNEAL